MGEVEISLFFFACVSCRKEGKLKLNQGTLTCRSAVGGVQKLTIEVGTWFNCCSGIPQQFLPIGLCADALVLSQHVGCGVFFFRCTFGWGFVQSCRVSKLGRFVASGIKEVGEACDGATLKLKEGKPGPVDAHRTPTTAGGEPAGILECELLLSLWHLACILCSRGYRPAPARDGVGWWGGRRGGGEDGKWDFECTYL